MECSGMSRPPAGSALMGLRPDQADNVLDRVHGLRRDTTGALSPIGKHGIDIGLVLRQPLELAPNRGEPRNRKIDQRGLERRELGAAKLVQYLGTRAARERAVDP